MSTKDDRFGDERLRKTAGADARASRDSADVQRTQQDGMELSAAERRRLIRQEWVQSVLPTLPKVEGFHLCWLSTTNSTDPIHKRIQLGYTPVRASEIPGFDQYKVDGGNFDGCIACQEMLLFKIPDQVYQDIMSIYHFDMPLEQEAAIKERVLNNTQQDSTGRELTSVEGDFQNLGRAPVQNPTFI